MVLDKTSQARSQSQGQRKRAKAMRRDLTNAEKLFWWEVKDRRLDGYKFRRQHPIGPYIADFACIEGKLVVEIDGGQHADAVSYDQQRDSHLQSRGFRVLRFWNAEVLTNMEGVIDAVLSALNGETGSPHPNPLPRRGRGDETSLAPRAPWHSGPSCSMVRRHDRPP